MTTRNDQDAEFEIPSTLKARCMRTYGWNDEFVERALQGYRQFMKLKIRLEDWHAKTLSPSLTVDFVWHQHILDVEHYINACNDYCGRLIGHNPDGGLDSAGREDRINATKIALRALFLGRDLDAEIWSFGPDSLSDNGNVADIPDRCDSKKMRHASVEEYSAAETSTLQGDQMTIRVRKSEDGEITVFKMKATTLMGKLFGAYAYVNRIGAEAAHLRFLLDGERIEPQDTPLKLKLEDNNCIDVMWEIVGC